MGVEVKILGKSFQVKSQYDEKFTADTAELVNSRMKELIGKSKNFSTETVAILAAMNIAGDYLRLIQAEGIRKEKIKKRLDIIAEVVQEKAKQFDTQREVLEGQAPKA
ncbi:MAG: cell division protein ZapA [Bdellovibrionota bacterium]|nr:cell division protein ZapA [Deltaproteobacteria bacterium]